MKFVNIPFQEMLRQLASQQQRRKQQLPDTVIIEPNPVRIKQHRLCKDGRGDGGYLIPKPRPTGPMVPIWRGRGLQTCKKLLAARKRARDGRWTGYEKVPS